MQLIRDDVLGSLVGLGTGSLRESHDAIVAKGGRFHLSGGSSKARGVTTEATRHTQNGPIAGEAVGPFSVGAVTTAVQWAWEELNLRPHAYQACALTT